MKTVTPLFFLVFLHCSPIFSQDQKEVFYEDFSSNQNGWFFDIDERNVTKIDFANQKLEMNIKDADGSQKAWVKSGLDFNKDFKFYTRVRTIQYGFENTTFSIKIGLFNAHNDENQGWYKMVVYADKSDAYVESISSEGKVLYSKKRNNPSAFDVDPFDEILIEKRANEIFYFLNNNIIYRDEITQISGDLIMFETQNKQRTFFDYIKIFQ